MKLARVYVTEGRHQHKQLMKKLHDEENVKGVSMFRAISGFGRNGQIHSSDLLTLSFDLPIVIEFFDEDEKVDKIVKDLQGVVPAGHTVVFKVDVI